MGDRWTFLVWEEEKRLSAVAIDVNMRDRKCLLENLIRNLHMLLLTCGG